MARDSRRPNGRRSGATGSSKRFFASPLPLAALPDVDAVVISHDHYDHLDLPTVKALLVRDVRWIVPRGIGAHLAAWGVPEARITELDWWEATEVNGVTLTATPARHFSGRGLTDANRTLWADVHLGPEQAVLAHRLVRGDVMLPVHWGMFNLALHGWTEPMERVLVAAQAAGARVATPRPGDMVEPASLGAPTRWWPTLPWQDAVEAPVRSSGVRK